MTKTAPSVQHVRQILGKYSIAPVRNWLKRRELSHTMNSREAMVTKVHGLLESGELTEDEVIEASIGIEEASSKRTFLYTIPHQAKDLARIEGQLAALKIPLSTERTPSVHPTAASKLVYMLNNTACLRAKWNEQHIRIRADKRRRTFDDVKEPKIIVLIVNKKTGIVQLRYDKPGDQHSHTIEDEPSDDAYFNYYLEKAENILGLPLEPVDLRVALERVLKAEPRIVKTNYTVDDAEDGSKTKRTQKKPGKDIRDTDGWKSMAANSTMLRTFEESPLWWISTVSNGELKRELFSYVDATNGFVRFDANCYEEEIEYVLHQLVPEISSRTTLA
jgi:hypothetical protein